jgi:rhodanese-related sulfurtransferase
MMNNKTVPSLVTACTLLISITPALADGGDSIKSDQGSGNAKTIETPFESGLPKISRSALQAKLGKVTLVCALRTWRFVHPTIEGSVYVPLDRIEIAAQKHLPDKNAELVVYAVDLAKSEIAERVADGLCKDGYKKISIYREGYVDWKNAGLPTEGTNPHVLIPKKTETK